MSILSSTHKLKVLSIAEDCLKDNSESDFKKILKNTEDVIGQKMTACGVGVGNAHAMKEVSNINAGFPNDFISKIVNAKGTVMTPLFSLWLENQSPQVLELNNISNPHLTINTTLYQEFSLRNVISHGVRDIGGHYVSYFGFANISEKIEQHHIMLIKVLVPYLHMAYVKLPSVKKSLASISSLSTVDNNNQLLSSREYEVLCWLFDGKSNNDIGNILKISDLTVKTHVQKIIKKLNADNRQHAVATALRMNLISL